MLGQSIFYDTDSKTERERFRFLFSDATNDQDGGLVNNVPVDIEGQVPIGKNRVSSFVT